MKSFGDFNIKPVVKGFDGKKIAVDSILNEDIIVEDYEIKKSKYPDKGNGLCLYIQIIMDDERRVVFSGSEVLQGMILQIPKTDMPFEARIVLENRRHEFRPPKKRKNLIPE